MIDIDPKIIELVRKRGIDTEEKLEEYFSDKPKETYDPFLLPDMEEGVDLVLSAIEEGKRICIYGDYDADGVTSTVIMTEVLSELTTDLLQYIPSRFDEGYGLNMSAIDTIKSRGAGLIITVDCGSVSVDEVAYAKELGMDVLVTDHHQIADRQADTFLINPARKDSEYPFPYLAGCGVAFKFAQALVDVAGIDRKVLTRALDMVAIGTIGDIVPLQSENRMLAKYGLRAINTGGREALSVLIEKTGLTPGEISAENVSFVIVPHINAAGRMDSAGLALRLFLAKTREDMEKYADKLIECNRERRRMQDEVFESAEKVVEEKYKDDDFLVVDLEDAHEGVAGIAAGKLKEKHKVPAVIVTDNGDGTLKGTGRSPEGIDLYGLLKNEEKWFTAFGGHAAACGFTMDKKGLGEMREDLNRRVRELKESAPGAFDREEQAELTLAESDVRLSFVDQLDLLEPCGCKNERPMVEFTGDPRDIGVMGRDGQFLRFTMWKGDTSLRCVAFSDTEVIGDIIRNAEDNGDKVKVIGYLGINEWNGNRSIQINVRSVR